MEDILPVTDTEREHENKCDIHGPERYSKVKAMSNIHIVKCISNCSSFFGAKVREDQVEVYDGVFSS